MQAKIDTYLVNDEVKHITASNGVWLEATITHPKSSEGRRLDIWIDQEMVTKLALLFKRAAIQARMGTMTDE